MYKQLDEFITYLSSEAGKSDNTCQSYRRDIRQFLDWLYSRYPIQNLNDIASEHIEAYAKLLQDSDRSPATVSRLIASLKAFFSYGQRSGWMSHDPGSVMKPPKVIKKAPKILTDTEILRLLSQPETDSAKGIRDKAMLELLCDTGLRVSELIGLQLNDIDIHKRRLSVGGSRRRSVIFDRKIVKYLENYIDYARNELIAGKEDTDSLFVNVSGEEMSRQGFWKIIKKYGDTAGIGKELTPHTLRHSFAAHALRSGRNIREVQKVLGHSDISTTSGYAGLK